MYGDKVNAKVSVQITKQSKTLVRTNHECSTFSEDEMSTLSSENSPEDVNNRSFWMVCALYVCVCVCVCVILMGREVCQVWVAFQSKQTK